MTMGKMKRCLAAMLAVIMICGMLPVEAIALDTSGTESGTCVCSEACTAEKQNAFCPVCSADLSKCKLSGSGEKEENTQMPAKEAPVENIVKQGEDGVFQMYVSLLNKYGGVITTTRPGGSASWTTTIDYGEPVTVQLEFGALKEAALEDGIDENVSYYLDLPMELVPVKVDAEGNKLVDPDIPLELFNNGTIQARGGIYSMVEGEKITYRLKFHFTHTADQVNIAANFQYYATVNDDLEPETIYGQVDFGGAGKVSFSTGKKAGETPSCLYQLFYTSAWNSGDASGERDTRINWTATVKDHTGETNDDPIGTPSLGTTLRISTGTAGKHGFISTMSNYVSTSPFQIEVTKTDGTTVTLTPQYRGKWYYFLGAPSDTNGYIASVEPTDFELGNMSSNSFIAKTLVVAFGNPDGSPVTGIKSWKISFSTWAYDNVQNPSTAYLLEGTLVGVRSDGSDYEWGYGTGRSYGSMSLGSANPFNKNGAENAFKYYAYGPNNCFGIYVPEYYKTTFTARQKDCYAGNYFAVHYYPHTDSNGNHCDYFGRANYYVCADAGRAGPLVDSNGYNGLFNYIKIDGNTITWTDDCFNQRSTSASCTVGKMASDLQGSTYNDPVLAYQIKRIFTSDSTTIRVFRSTTPASDGKYYYVVLAPEFVSNARTSPISGFSGYSKYASMSGVYGYSSTYTRQPGDWMVYVFNTAGLDVEFQFTERLGDFNRIPTSSGGSLYNKLELNYGYYNPVCWTSRFSNSYNPIDTLSARYVTASKTVNGKKVDQNWIEWTGEFDFTGYGGKFNDRFSRIYVKVPAEVSFASDYSSSVDGGFTTANLLRQTSSGWTPIGGTPYRTNSSYDWQASGLKQESGYVLYYWNYGSLANSSNYRDSNGKVRLRFFTQANDQLPSSDSYTAGVINCEVSLQIFSGDLSVKTSSGSYGSNSGDSLLSFQSQVKGVATQPIVIKSIYSAGYRTDDGQKLTRLRWQIEGYMNRSGDFFDGTWRFSDSMKNSTVTLEDGTPVNVNPGKYTILSSDLSSYALEVTVYGYSTVHLEFTQSDLDWAIHTSDHKVKKTVSCYDSSTGSYYDITATLTYSGDMETGFDFQLDGLRNCTHVSLGYYTVLDDFAFATAIDPDDLTKLYQLNLKNSVTGGWVNQNAVTASAEYKTNIVAALAVKKTATNIMNSLVPPSSETAAKLNPWDTGWDGKSTSYTVTATVGASPTEYLRITDHLSKYTERANWLEDAASTTYDAPENLAALAESLKLDGLKITMQELWSGSPTVIYENGTFANGWTSSTLTMRSDLPDSVKAQFPGALYQLVLKHEPSSTGEPLLIGSGVVITITYTGTLEMDTEIADGKTFRQSDYYNGGVLEITNNVSAARTYTNTAVQTLGGSVLGTELICDAGSGATGKYLVDKKIGKTYTTQVTEDGKQTYHFLIAERTEQSGKDTPVVEISDVISTFVSETNLKKLMDQGHSEEESMALLVQLDALLLKYTTVSNLSIYYNEENPALTTEKDHLCYEQEGPVSEVTGKVVADGKILDVTFDSEYTGCMFTVKLSNMGYGEVVVVDYDLEINWRDFLNEAERLGLLTNGMMFGEVTPVTTVHNSVYEAEKGYVSSSESKVEISGMSAGKKLLSNDTAGGKAKWQVDVNTGYIDEGNTLTISDTVTPTAKDEAVAQAVGKALSVTNVKLVLQGAELLTIYENGALTEAAQAAGWKRENLSVTVDGLSVTVSISNTDALRVLEPEQTYQMSYETVLDKNRYVSALVEAGLTMDDAEYTLENAAQAQRGSFSASADSKVTQKPKAPVTLDKTSEHPEKDNTSIIWTVKGNTADVDRQDFVIRDLLTGIGTDADDVLSHTSVAWMTITLTTADGSPVEIFNNRDGQSVDRLAELGAKLEAISDLNGETEGDFTFAADGKYGFSLSFESLEKNTIVTVTYKTVLNVSAYEASKDQKLTLTNSAKLTTADGSFSNTTETTTVTVTRMMEKAGKKDGKTADGNDILLWTIPLDLRSKYTLDELGKVKSVSLVDDLHPGLAYMFGSLKVYERVPSSSGSAALSRGKVLPADAYQMELSGNRLTIRLLKPAEYPAVEIEFQTEVRASIAGLTNVMYLNVDGKSFRYESTPLPPVTAAGQTGYITSIHAPEWTPQLYKYLDGKAEMTPGIFSFTLTEVTQDGTPIEGGYSETVTNNEKGEIPFATIRYAIVENGDIHYYKVTENDCTGYKKETAEYMIRVLITRLTDSFQLSVTTMTENEGDPFTFYNSTLVEIKGQKVWNDEDNQDGKRPDHVTVYLYADGKLLKELDVTAGEDGKWNWSFGELPRTVFGKTIQYSVLEKAVKDYTTKITGNAEDGFTITNSYTPSKTELTVTKTWEDANNQDGIRPTEVTVKLLANGVETGKTLILKAAENWTGSFTNLDEYAAGVKIVYTVKEVPVAGYTASVEYDLEKSSASITNVHEPAKIDISGEKVWNDDNDWDGVRPAQIVVKLMKDGKEIDFVTVTKEDNWKWSFRDLPKFANGQEIVYTVAEEAVEGYTATITGNADEGFTITNSHRPVTPPNPVSVEITAEKTLDGKAPTENCFTFVLTDKEGNIVQTVKNAAGKITFSSMRFTEAGTYIYTLTEQKGNQSGIVYDTAAYTVIITVTEDGKNLAAVVAYQKDGKEYTGTPLFANTTKEISDIPQTGDEFRMELGICLAMVSAFGLAATLFAGRKRYRGKYAMK